MQKKLKNLCIAETRKPSKSKFNKLMKQFAYGYCPFWSL